MGWWFQSHPEIVELRMFYYCFTIIWPLFWILYRVFLGALRVQEHPFTNHACPFEERKLWFAQNFRGFNQTVCYFPLITLDDPRWPIIETTNQKLSGFYLRLLFGDKLIYSWMGEHNQERLYTQGAICAVVNGVLWNLSVLKGQGKYAGSQGKYAGFLKWAKTGGLGYPFFKKPPSRVDCICHRIPVPRGYWTWLRTIAEESCHTDPTAISPLVIAA